MVLENPFVGGVPAKANNPEARNEARNVLSTGAGAGAGMGRA